MAEAPINEDGSSGPQITNAQPKTPKSHDADANVTTAQLSASNTSPPAPFTPSNPLSDKRKRLKPARYHSSSTNAKTKQSPSKHKGVSDPSRKEKAANKDSNTPVEISPTMIRAREVQSSLLTDHPSFIKTMLRSHVTSCFWMGLPVPFCKSFLPQDDTSMVVEDENGLQYNLKYIAYKTGLSAGWRKFAIVHKLLEGDVLIFQLVEPCKFKIYIVRTNEMKEGDGALNLPNCDVHKEYMAPAPITAYPKSKAKKRSGLLPIISMDRKKHKHPKCPTPLSSHAIEYPEVQGVFPKPNFSIEDVKTFEDFHIMVNNRCIDSELSDDIRMSYYKLCIGKKEFLHDGLPIGLYDKLVAGMIGETVGIAKAIKCCKINTRKEEFEVWDSSLESFELLGMKVGFLRDRLRILETMASKSEDARRYVEAKEERYRNAVMLKNLKAKVAELRECNKKIDKIIDGLKEEAEGYEVEFQEKVNAPW